MKICEVIWIFTYLWKTGFIFFVEFITENIVHTYSHTALLWTYLSCTLSFKHTHTLSQALFLTYRHWHTPWERAPTCLTFGSCESDMWSFCCWGAGREQNSSPVINTLLELLNEGNPEEKTERGDGGAVWAAWESGVLVELPQWTHIGKGFTTTHTHLCTNTI